MLNKVVSRKAIEANKLKTAQVVFLSLQILFIFFLERGEGKEKERQRNINVWLPLTCPQLGTWPATQACAVTGNPTGNPVVHRPMLSPLSYTSQGNTGGFLCEIHTIEILSKNYFLDLNFCSLNYSVNESRIWNI